MACSYTASGDMTPGDKHVSQSLTIVFGTALYYNTPTLWALCRAPSTRVSSAEIIRWRSLSVFLRMHGVDTTGYCCSLAWTVLRHEKGSVWPRNCCSLKTVFPFKPLSRQPSPV